MTTEEGNPESPPGDPELDGIPVLVEVRGDYRPLHRLSDSNILGRSPECSVWIMDALASRRHAEINRNSDGDFEILDLESTFGTFVNKKKITRHLLRVGDEIFIGATQLKFEIRPTEEAALRRHQNRLSCNLSARVVVGDSTIETAITNLSLGGVRVDWQEPLELGTEVEVEIDLPNGDGVLKQRGRASHWSDDEGLGVRFELATEQDEQRLAEIYAKLYLASGAELDPD